MVQRRGRRVGTERRVSEVNHPDVDVGRFGSTPSEMSAAATAFVQVLAEAGGRAAAVRLVSRCTGCDEIEGRHART